MKEPYYVITKVTTSAATSSSQAITESELKRRFSRAAEKYRCYDHPWESVLNVLLHGEGEKEEESQFAPKDVSPYTRVFGIDDQPSPTPTRAEWEAWVEKRPRVLEYADWRDWAASVMGWIYTMPCVPKEE